MRDIARERERERERERKRKGEAVIHKKAKKILKRLLDERERETNSGTERGRER